MADQEQVIKQVQGATNQDQAVQPDQETTEQKIATAIEASISPLKAQIDGLNKRNSKLEKEKRDAELAQLPEKEQYEARLAALDERDVKTAEKEKAIERQAIVNRVKKDYKLTDKLAERLLGESAAEIELDAKYLSDFVAQEVQTKSTETVNKKLSGNPPVGGATKVLTEIQGLELKMKQATASGDMETANAIYLHLKGLKRT